jgi:hypothetical protein
VDRVLAVGVEDVALGERGDHLPIGTFDVRQPVPDHHVPSGALLDLLGLLHIALEGLHDGDLLDLLGAHGAVVQEGRGLRLQHHLLVLARRDLHQPWEGVPAQQRGQGGEEDGEGEQYEAGFAAHGGGPLTSLALARW